MKRKLIRCAPHAYYELTWSDILGPSGARPARLPFLRPSPTFVMKPPASNSSSPSISESLIENTTQGELQARLEVFAKKTRSVKRKPLTFPEGCPPARGKIQKLGASSSPLSVVEAEDSLGRETEPPLEVLHLLVWSPTSQGAAPPSAMPDEVKRDRDCFDVVGSEDSLLSHAELAARAVSSILLDSNLRKVDALSVEEALALVLQGTASVCPSTFVDPFLYCFSSVS